LRVSAKWTAAVAAAAAAGSFDQHLVAYTRCFRERDLDRRRGSLARERWPSAIVITVNDIVNGWLEGQR
ncbi:MAG: hypothetical protein AAFN74_21915, partial [Myxococcota bacterium]